MCEVVLGSKVSFSFKEVMEEVATELVQKQLLAFIVTVKGGASHICEVNDILNCSGFIALIVQKL